MEQIRSFIAIELPAEVRASLARLQAILKKGSGELKWVEPKNMHLTLKFLGNVDANKTGAITSAIREAARDFSTFSITVSGLGVFPNARRVRVVWVGLTGDLDKLAGLQKAIEEKVSPLGYPAEDRSFSPHLTLARVRDFAGNDARQALGSLIEKTAFNENHTFTVRAVNLMRSQLRSEGPIYSKLSVIELK